MSVAAFATVLADVEDRLLRLQHYYETIAKPFEWKFSRADLTDRVKRIGAAPTMLRPGDPVQ